MLTGQQDDKAHSSKRKKGFHLLLATIVGSVLGGAVTFLFQQQLLNKQTELQEKERQIVSAMDLNRRISSNMDKRLHCIRRLVSAMERGNNNELAKKQNEPLVKQQIEAYRKVLDDWNGQLNLTFSNLEITFSKKEREEFEEIHGEFRNIGLILEDIYYRLYPKKIKIQFSKIRNKIDSLNEKVQGFNQNLTNIIIMKKGSQMNSNMGFNT